MRSMILFLTLFLIIIFSYVHSEDEAPERLVLTVQQGQQADQRQTFQVNSGEAVFIPIGQTNLNVPTTPKPDPQEIAYQAQRGQLSQKIADKIAEIQAKQAEYDNETYLAYKAPLELDKQRLTIELQALEAQRSKLEDQKIYANAVKAQANAAIPEQPAQTPQGLYIKSTLQDDEKSVALNVRSQDTGEPKSSEINSTIVAPLGKWLQVPNQNIWVKVNKGS